MATPAQLVHTVALVLGVPESRVINHDRNLAKAGIRPVGGRGTGAAHMTPIDAAALLIAVVASDEVRESVTAVTQYGSLQRTGSSPEYAWPSGLVQTIDELPERHTFKEGLAALISDVRDKRHKVCGEINVVVHWPVKRTSILYYVYEGAFRRTDMPPYTLNYGIGVERRHFTARTPYNREGAFDLTYEKVFSDDTIISVAETLRGERIERESYYD